MGDTKRSEGFPYATTTKLDIVIVSYMAWTVCS